MHRFLALPFAVLVIATATIVFVPSKIAGGVFVVGFISTLACVPLISRRSIVLGYASLIVPFVGLALVIVFSQHTTVTAGTPTINVEVSKDHTYYWKAPGQSGSKEEAGRGVVIRGESSPHFGPAVVVPENSKPPIKAPGGTTSDVTPPAAQEPRH